MSEIEGQLDIYDVLDPVEQEKTSCEDLCLERCQGACGVDGLIKEGE